jgi:uncharacterized RDD family membrane protein YckC
MKMTTPIKSLLVAVFGLWFGAVSLPAQPDGATPPVEASALSQTNSENTQPLENLDETILNDQEKVRGVRREAIVVFGKTVELNAEDYAETVVVIGGTAKIHGKVRGEVVVIGGDAEVDGKVGREVVAIGGKVTLDGKVGRDVVAVLGGVKLGPKAEVGHEVVAIGGRVDVSDGARIRGRVQEVDLELPGFPKMESLRSWFVHCVLKLRPLAPQVGWVWVLWAGLTLIYLLVAVLFPRPVQACVQQLTARPASTFLAGLLAKIILPVIVLVLAMTGVGLLVVPFIFAAQLIGLIAGKVAILEYFGQRVGRQTGMEVLQKPLVAFLIGTVIITLLYLVPVFGLLTLGVISLWGFGAAVMALFAGLKREAPKPRPFAPLPPAGLTATAFTGVPAAAVSGAMAAEDASQRMDPAGPAMSMPAQAGLPVPVALARAGFWIRMAAGLLDAALIIIVIAILANTGLGRPFRPPMAFILALAYFAGMWAWKGTTVGGIVLKLQVLRYDGGQVSFAVALVRGLAAAFSAVALFLGFFWIGWDPDKQGWHDKIAGTVVVQVPRSMPLVCL